MTKKQETDLRRARQAKAIYSDELLDHPDVHGVGVGFERKDGEKTRRVAVVVHVYRKRDPEDVAPDRLLPDALTFFSKKDGKEVSVPLDVREVAPPTPEVACPDCGTDFGDRVRPVPGGYSFGLSDEPGGTMGGYVWDNVTDQIVFISNEHVLGSTVNDRVIQPSIGDGGSSPADDFGRVLRAGTLDVAIGTVDDADDRELEIECVAPAVYEIADATLEMVVEKAGQTTGLTCGIVELIDYNSNHYGSNNDLWIDGDGNDFSQGGDSGSLYVEKTHPEGADWKRVVGIHWGGSGDDGVGHPMRAAAADLDVTTLCSGLVRTLIEALFGRESERESEKEAPSSRGLRRGLRHYPAFPGTVKPGVREPRFFRGIARDVEARLREGRAGAAFLKAFHAHRVDVVRVLTNRDGWRAASAALGPILKGKVTTDDVLKHTFSGGDVERLRRVMEVAERVRPEIGPLLEQAEGLLSKADGQTLAAVAGVERRAKSRRKARQTAK